MEHIIFVIVLSSVSAGKSVVVVYDKRVEDYLLFEYAFSCSMTCKVFGDRSRYIGQFLI